MTKRSEISFDDFLIEGLREILREVDQVCRQVGVDCFVVGSLARNYWNLLHDEGIPFTKDIDLAICIEDHQTFTLLKERLSREFGYHPRKGASFTVISPSRKAVDLMPFRAPVENSDPKNDSHKSGLNMMGFSEVYRYGTKEVTIEDLQIKVCKLPSIVVLKLLAYNDRPEHRIKDVKDIRGILDNFLWFEQDMIFEEYLFLYDGEKDEVEIAFTALGSEMSKITSHNVYLHKTITEIIESAIKGETKLSRLLIRDSINETIEDMNQFLTHIVTGMSTANQ